MADPVAARSFLLSEIETLERFAFVAAAPAGNPLHAVEVVRREDSRLAVRIPGRQPLMPELPIAVRAALRDRGFASEEPGDRAQPWVKEVESAEAAVTLLGAVLVEVFGEKPDMAMDVGHGSYRIEHEARQKLARARGRIESIVTDLLGRRPDQDADGDYELSFDGVHVVVAPRAASDAQIVVRVFAICNVGIHVTADLGLLLARLNFGLMFGRFALDVEHRAIWVDETLIGEEFREDELRFVIRMVAATADAWDDRFKQLFGGSTYEEVLSGSGSQSAPSAKPGQGIGMYL